MKRIAWLLLAVLCSTLLLRAEDEGNTMTGWVCDSKCIVHDGDRTTCNPKCTERSGAAVFIDDYGTVFQVSNPAFCASHMNQRVKAKGTKNKDKQVTFMDLQEEGGIGH